MKKYIRTWNRINYSNYSLRANEIYDMRGVLIDRLQARWVRGLISSSDEYKRRSQRITDWAQYELCKIGHLR